MNKEIKENFESWILAKFGDDPKGIKLGGSDTTGYFNLSTNQLWIGFQAGVESAEEKLKTN